jgi:predicted N-acyltransferase
VVVKREVQVFKTVDEIGKESIDAIANDGFFTYGYFKTVETSKTFDVAPFYLAVSDEDGIVAIAPCYIESDKRFRAFKKKFPFMRGLASAVNSLGLYTNHLMASYSPESYHSKLLLRENHDVKTILSLLSTKIDEICRRRHILFSSFPHVPESERQLIENLENFGYNKSPSLNIFNLDIKWSSFDDYLKSLDPHNKFRTTVRREIKKCKESGVTIVEEKEFGDLSATLLSLHSNLKKKHEKSVESARNTSFFRKLSEYAKDKTRVLVARRNGKIVGFSLSLQHNDILDVHMCGFDYSTQASTDFTYFNIGYYMPIRLAIEEGIKKIHYSINEDRVKLKRGCKQEKTYSFVKCHNRIFGSLYSLHTKESRPRQNAD